MLNVIKLTKQTLRSDTMCKINSKVNKTLGLRSESWGGFEQYLSKTTLQVTSTTSIQALDLLSVSDIKFFKISIWI